MFGNGLSSSPSNTPFPFDRSRYPHFTIYDNVMVQHRLIAGALGIAKLRLVYGWSMGGIQAYHWAGVLAGNGRTNRRGVRRRPLLAA